MTKVKSVVVLNPPTTPEEQKALDQKISKALALGLYRSLGPEKVDILLEAYRQAQKEKGGD